MVLETVEFYIRKCKPLEEYLPAQVDGDPPRVSSIVAGYHLTFNFVCGYGSSSTFGSDKKLLLMECTHNII